VIDQSKFEEHLNNLRAIVAVLDTADDQQEAFDYLDRLHQAFAGEILNHFIGYNKYMS